LQKVVTIQDVARAAGVAKATVSYAFSGKGQLTAEKREAVLQVARDLGYEPNLHAQRLANGGCHKTISLICRDVDIGVGTRKINRIQQLLAEQGYEVPIHACGFYGGGEAEMQAALLRDLCRQRPRAIVCAAFGLHPDALAPLARYQKEGGVVVCYDHEADLDCDQVIFDREDNTYQATRHLLEAGHRAIGLYMHGPQSSWPEERVQGFRRALAEWGLEALEEWLFSGGLYEEGGAQLAEQFLGMPERPSGLCLVNDQAALGFIVTAQRHGLRIPQDVSLVGHDDAPAARYNPVPLTTVSHPVEAIAQQVVELLSSRIEGRYSASARRVKVRGELVRRESVAPPASGR
jgi:DNA-binding LacI/PurR family transcriptional regulator